jgi:DNA-binding NarL/FixJ family response regulator
MKKVKIALVDDEDLIISLLGEFFMNADGIELCFTAKSGELFIDLLSSGNSTPEIVILDLKMSGMSGLDVMEYISEHHKEIKVIVMSSYYRKSFMGFMLKTGVSAFLPKNISPKKLLEIILEIRDKNFYFMDDQVETIREQVSSKAPKLQLTNADQLSEREIEILRLVCMQKSAKEIADELFLTHRTVEGHKNKIFAKTSAKNNAGLVIYAIQNQIVNIDEIPLI